MLKKYPKIKRVIKYTLISLFSLAFLIFCFGYWFFSLLPEKGSIPNYTETTSAELPYLQTSIKEERGKILIVVTSTATMGESGKSTGYELTELARPYYVFVANGFTVDIASPKGGEPPVVIDNDDMGPYDYAFLNDPEAQNKVKQSIAIHEVDAQAYEAVFFAGGKGAMFDFPNNPHIQSIVASLYENQKIIGAVCHGPAALVNVSLSDGSTLISGKKMSGFTNEEELFLIPKAADIFPFLLEDKLRAQGADIVKTSVYLQQVSVDGRLVSGQNPWSTWQTAESMIRQMGYTPHSRKISPQENSVSILMTYARSGKKAAMDQLIAMMSDDVMSVDRFLLAQHCLVEGMQFHLGKTIDLLALLRKAQKLSS